MKNYHQELLKIVPKIYNNQQIMLEMFESVMVHSPKALLDAWNRIHGIVDMTDNERILYEIIKDFCDYKLNKHQLSTIVGFYENNKPIEAIKEIREITRLGLKEAKCEISDVFRSKTGL